MGHSTYTQADKNVLVKFSSMSDSEELNNHSEAQAQTMMSNCSTNILLKEVSVICCLFK